VHAVARPTQLISGFPVDDVFTSTTGTPWGGGCERWGGAHCDSGSMTRGAEAAAQLHSEAARKLHWLATSTKGHGERGTRGGGEEHGWGGAHRGDGGDGDNGADLVGSAVLWRRGWMRCKRVEWGVVQDPVWGEKGWRHGDSHPF
jgi:hypothetical protein